MKTWWFLLPCLLVFSLAPASAQMLKVGAKAGLGSRTVTPKDLFIRNSQDLDSLSLRFQSSRPSVQAGVFARLSLLGVYVQPELLLTFANSTYEAGELDDADQTSSLRERLVYLDIPVTAGMAFGPLRLQGGPVFTRVLGRNTELTNLNGVERNFKTSSVAGQLGLGVDIWKLTFDVKYEFPLRRNRDSLTLFGREYGLSTRRAQVLWSVGYVF